MFISGTTNPWRSAGPFQRPLMKGQSVISLSKPTRFPSPLPVSPPFWRSGRRIIGYEGDFSIIGLKVFGHLDLGEILIDLPVERLMKGPISSGLEVGNPDIVRQAGDMVSIASPKLAMAGTPLAVSRKGCTIQGGRSV